MADQEQAAATPAAPTTKVVLKAPGGYEASVDAAVSLDAAADKALDLMHQLTGNRPAEKTGPIL